MTEAAIGTVNLQEDRLAEGVRLGNPEAWRSLYVELGEPVFRLLHRLTGDEDWAQDLTHDTFVAVFEKGYQYSGRGSLAGWVFRIAANLAKERLRRDHARGRRDQMVMATRPDRTEGPDTELRLVLDAALNRVTPEQRAVLLLHDVDGYTHPEIARMLKIAPGTSKARLSRARARLRHALQHAL